MSKVCFDTDEDLRAWIRTKTCALAAGIVSVVCGMPPASDPHVNEIGRLPARTYSMPLASVEEAFTDDEPSSKWTLSLNGLWRFHWCGEPALKPEGFQSPDFDDSDW